MSKKMKLWLLIATAAIVIGCIMLGVVMSIMGWDLSKLSTMKYVTNEYVIDEEFQNIRVSTGTTNVVFIPTKDETAKVICKELEKVRHLVTVEDGTLVIAAEDEREWYDHIGINFDSPKITVYLPENNGTVSAMYGSISVQGGTGDVNCFVSATEINLHTTTGDIFVENISAGAMELSVSTGSVTVVGVTCGSDIQVDASTGRVNVMNVHCKSFSSEGSTGDVILERLLTEEQIFVRRSTGNVKFDHCDAMALIRVEVNTGDIKGSFLSGKIFSVNTNTGNVDVPVSEEGHGECQISTRTGNVRIIIDENPMI